MRTILVLSALVLLGVASQARADVTGIYDVKFEEVSTNCTHPLRYPPGKLTIKIVGRSLTVDIDRTPLMGGVPSKNNRISAKSRSGNTMVDGMTGVFSVAGTVTPEGLLHLVMVGEYSAKKKPLCSQSWNVDGLRVDTIKKSQRKGKRSRTPVHAGELGAIVNDFVHLVRFDG